MNKINSGVQQVGVSTRGQNSRCRFERLGLHLGTAHLLSAKEGVACIRSGV